jgi:hypothetical protein
LLVASILTKLPKVGWPVTERRGQDCHNEN